MTIRMLACAAIAAMLLTAGAHAQDQGRPPTHLANYFFCNLEEGKTRADLIAFKADYEKAVAEAGLAGYELRLQFPLYADDIREGHFVWEGSWADFEEMAKISRWFRASEWPARFDEIMSCERSSLWNVMD